MWRECDTDVTGGCYTENCVFLNIGIIKITKVIQEFKVRICTTI